MDKVAGVDLKLPSITMDDLEDDAKLQKILSYLYQLNEQLRYELTHIDDENISPEGISDENITNNINRTLTNDKNEAMMLYANARKLLLQLSSKVENDLGYVIERLGKIEVTAEALDAEFSEVKKTQNETNEKVANLEVTAEGITTTVSEVQQVATGAQNAADAAAQGLVTLTEKVSKVEQTAEGITTTVSEVQKVASNAQSAANSAQSTANSAQGTADAAAQGLVTLTEKVSKVEQTAEGLKTTVSEVQQAASNAQSAANDAQSAANNAQSAANSAQGTADAAAQGIVTLTEKVSKVEQTADGLKTTVSEVQQAASNAQSAANDAQSAANDAKSAANNAQSAANSAQGTANSAQGTANAAAQGLVTITERVAKVEQTAEGLATTVSEVQQAASNAQSAASNAQSAANNAQSAANSAQGTANAAAQGLVTLTEKVSKVEQTADGLAVEVGKRVTQAQVDESIGKIEEFHNTAVDITAQGVKMNTTGAIVAYVDGVLRLNVDETGVSAPMIVADNVQAPNLVIKNLSVIIPWKGGIQASIDAAPKWLMQNATLVIPAGIYQENVEVSCFKGATLTLSFTNGVTLLGTLSVHHCDSVSVAAAELGQGKIYPPVAAASVVSVSECGNFSMENMHVSGYRGRTSASNGTGTGIDVVRSRATIMGCCVEYTSTYGILFYQGAMGAVQSCTGGQIGLHPATNANLQYGVFLSAGCHANVYDTVPIGGVSSTGQWLSTLLGADQVTPAAGGMEYVAPAEFTQTFRISKHCTYLYSVQRIRDDQSTTLSQGHYGGYTAGGLNWRTGAMWFADAAEALQGKQIVSATLRLRRAYGGLNQAVPVYLGTVALTESAFASTLTPPFTASGNHYPGEGLEREEEATYDVTALMTAVQAGHALAVREPTANYGSGASNFSNAYTYFYGKGSEFEPVLSVTYLTGEQPEMPEDVSFVAYGDNVTMSGTAFTQLADGAVQLDNATFTAQDDGSVLIE